MALEKEQHKWRGNEEFVCWLAVKNDVSIDDARMSFGVLSVRTMSKSLSSRLSLVCSATDCAGFLDWISVCGTVSSCANSSNVWSLIWLLRHGLHEKR